MPTLKLLLFHQRGVGVVLLNYLLMNTGFYLLVPFIALHGTRDLGLTAAMAGVVLGVRQFVQQGLGIFGGALGDRIGYKATLSAGLLVRAVGFASFAFATDTRGLLLAALISALGGALYDAPSNAVLAMLTPMEHRAAAFSLYGIASRLGSAIGPALGIWLLAINFGLLSVVAAAFYVVGLVLLFFGMPALKPAARLAAESGTERSFVSSFMVTLRDRPFVRMVALNAGYWFLFVQFTISLPLYVYQRFGGLEALSAYYVINSVPAVFVQYFLLQYLNQHWTRARILVVGMCLIALGMGTIGIWSLPLLVVLSASVYALGDLLYQPTQYTLVSDLARSDMLASYFGFAAFALAIGGGAGNVLGGIVFDIALARGEPGIVWYGYGMVGLVIAAGLALWARTGRRASART
jgi:DHA1 family multidrug resistance protein-like MFS transporter